MRGKRKRRRQKNESEHGLEEEGSTKKRSNNTKSLKNGEGKEMINIQKNVLLTSKFFIK